MIPLSSLWSPTPKTKKCLRVLSCVNARSSPQVRRRLARVGAPMAFPTAGPFFSAEAFSLLQVLNGHFSFCVITPLSETYPGPQDSAEGGYTQCCSQLGCRESASTNLGSRPPPACGWGLLFVGQRATGLPRGLKELQEEKRPFGCRF